MPAPEPTVWPVLHYEDTEAALHFLERAFGFRIAAGVRDDDGQVVHGELRWPAGGAVVVGSTRHREGVHADLRPGTAAAYVVSDEVDEVCARAEAAGAEIVAAPHETEFGTGEPTRAFTAKDPEGNLWTFASYRGA